MIKNPTHRERMEACLSGRIIDRPPVSLWRHFPVDDQSPDTLAAATVNFQTTFDFDFIKVSPSSSYCLKDWGSQDAWEGNPEGSRKYTNEVIQRFDDWNNLHKLNPKTGKLGDMLETLRLIHRQFAPHTPIMQSIFSPLSQAKNLVGRDRLTYHLRACPEAVHMGLQAITDTTIDFLEEARKAGIDGIFFAVQHAQYQILSEMEFETFGRFYDLQVLAAIQDLWLNMAHIHGDTIMFDRVADYPVQILNWHDRQTPPTLGEAQHRTEKTVCGGLKQWETMVLANPQAVTAEAIDAIRQTEGINFILGTGCVVPVTAPYGNIMAARTAVETFSAPVR
jgi:uroporphyrinogen decarboxylase